MRRGFILILSFFCSVLSYSQDVYATTDDGKRVILYENGQWIYSPTYDQSKQKDDNYVKSDGATQYVDARIKTVRIWYNPDIWNAQKLDDGTAEYQFASKDGGLYARIITEKMKVPKDLMRQVIEMNAKRAAQVFEPIEENEITVNGIRLNRLKVHVKIKDMDLLFLYYYFSDDNGTVQLFAYTSVDIFNKYEEDITEFMNGIMIN